MQSAVCGLEIINSASVGGPGSRVQDPGRSGIEALVDGYLRRVHRPSRHCTRDRSGLRGADRLDLDGALRREPAREGRRDGVRGDGAEARELECLPMTMPTREELLWRFGKVEDPEGT